MSTLAYARLTTAREESTPGKSSTTQPPQVGTYIDAFAALVPAEVLTLHAVIMSYTTAKASDGSTQILAGNMSLLQSCFWILIVVSMVLYAGGRLSAKKWDRLDYIRILIPPLAFTGWTMIQTLTAFDAVWGNLPKVNRDISAILLCSLLGYLSTILADKADAKTPASPAKETLKNIVQHEETAPAP